MRLERHDGYWLLIGIAAPGATATTLGPLILMREHRVGNARLLRHELEHVRQWREQGWSGFLRRYLGRLPAVARCRATRTGGRTGASRTRSRPSGSPGGAEVTAAG